MTSRRYRLSLLALLCSLGPTLAAQSTLDPRNTPVPQPPASASPAASAAGLGMTIAAAHVAAGGALTNDSGATASSHSGTGFYAVEFNRDVSSCFYAATSFNFGYTITAQPRNNDKNGVFLALANSGTAADGEFYLVVYCAK